MNDLGRSLDETASIRWGEILLTRDVDTARAWLARVKLGVGDGDLADMCKAFKQPLDEVWAACEATVYRHGRRVVLGPNACPKSWEPSRPCVLEAGHAGPCPIADVPIAKQREAQRRYEEELGAVVAAFGGTR